MGWIVVRNQGIASSVDLLACRLVVSLALFFFGFDVLGAIDLFFPGRWVTFLNATLVVSGVAALAWVWSRRRPATIADHAELSMQRVTVPSIGGTTRLVASLLIAGFSLMAALLVIGFPRGFEANAYHLPSAVNFFRDGSLRVWDAR